MAKQGERIQARPQRLEPRGAGRDRVLVGVAAAQGEIARAAVGERVVAGVEPLTWTPGEDVAQDACLPVEVVAGRPSVREGEAAAGVVLQEEAGQPDEPLACALRQEEGRRHDGPPQGRLEVQAELAGVIHVVRGARPGVLQLRA